MAFNTGNEILRNPPVPVYFQGFQSNTHTLAQCGWTMTLDQDLYNMTILCVFTNLESGAILISESHRFNFQRMAHEPFYVNDLKFNTKMYRGDVRLPMQFDYRKLVEVDTEPSYETIEMGNLKDYVLFKEKPKNEVLVEPATVPEMLEMIKKMQSPTQKELREKQTQRAKRGIYEMENEPRVERHIEILSVI